MLSHFVPWQMKNTDEFHKDVATGRNEKKGLCMVGYCRISLLPGFCGLSAGELHMRWFCHKTTTTLGFISLFECVCVRFMFKFGK